MAGAAAINAGIGATAAGGAGIAKAAPAAVAAAPTIIRQGKEAAKVVAGKNIAKETLEILLGNKESSNEISKRKESKRSHATWWGR